MEKLLLFHRTADEVDGLHHTPRGQNTEHRVEIRIILAYGIVQRECQIFAARGIDLEAQLAASFDKGLEIVLRWLWMPSQHSKLGKFFFDFLGHRNVGQQHELFDHGICVA